MTTTLNGMTAERKPEPAWRLRHPGLEWKIAGQQFRSGNLQRTRHGQGAE